MGAGIVPERPQGTTEGSRRVIGVGGVIRMDGGVLLARLTYSRQRGRYMFPGGKVDDGESLEAALRREVREETNVDAEPRGIVAVRHRVHAGELNIYVMFLMDCLGGSPRPNGREHDAVGVFGVADFAARPDQFVGIVPPVAERALAGTTAPLDVAGFVPVNGGYTAESFRLYVADV